MSKPNIITLTTNLTKAKHPVCRELAAYVEAKNFWQPGHGDLQACLEMYTLCADGSYHRIDSYGVKFPTVVVPLQVQAGRAPRREVLIDPECRIICTLHHPSVLYSALVIKFVAFGITEMHSWRCTVRHRAQSLPPTMMLHAAFLMTNGLQRLVSCAHR